MANLLDFSTIFKCCKFTTLTEKVNVIKDKLLFED